MAWELVENLNDYDFDKSLYGEMPEKLSHTQMDGMLTAIKISDRLAIRQAARISQAIKKFNRNSGRLSGLMIAIILFQLIILILGLVR